MELFIVWSDCTEDWHRWGVNAVCSSMENALQAVRSIRRDYAEDNESLAEAGMEDDAVEQPDIEIVRVTLDGDVCVSGLFAVEKDLLLVQAVE